MRVLLVAAHPDDGEIGAGGVLALHSMRGDEVFALILTLGERGGNPEERVEEALKGCEILGVKEVFFGDLPDTSVMENLSRAISTIEETVREFEPDRVYSPSSRDRHQDHVATSMAVDAACKNVKENLKYETPSTLTEFSPQYFVDISKSISRKIEAISAHKSQIRKHRFRIEAIKGLASFRGYQMGVEYAEAFEVRWILRDGP